MNAGAALQLFLHHVKFIAAMSALAMLVGAVVTFLSTPQYTAKVSILPATPANGLSQLGMAQFASVASNLGFGTGAGGVAVAFPDILRSRQVRERVLWRKYTTERDGLVLLEDYLTDANLKGSMQTAKALRELEIRMRVSMDKLSGVLQLMVTMPEAKLSAQVAAAFVDELVQVEAGLHQQTAQRNRQFIELRLAETTQALQEAESKLTHFREHNLRIGNDPQLQLQGERLLREVEIQKQVYLTLTQQHEIAKIDETHSGAGIQVIDPAKEPFSKSSPILLKNLVLGAFFGCVGAGVLVVGASWWRTARTAAALQRA